jgi:hypothetical protein
MLGVHLAPGRNNKKEFEVLCGKVKTWAENIRTGQLQRKYVYQSLTSTLIPQLSYALAATTLSVKECTHLDSMIRRATLPAEGINRNFPTTLAYGSEKKHGLALIPFYDRQGMEAIARLVKFAEDPHHFSGNPLRTSIELLNIEIGTQAPALSMCFETFGHLATKCWLKSTWQFISSAKIMMSSPPNGLQIKRTNDKFLSEAFESKASPDHLNKCRLYLQAITLADITNAEGTAISNNAWLGTKSTSIQGWPNQSNTQMRDWTLWRESRHRIFGTNASTGTLTAKPSRFQKIKQPLGDWITNTPQEWELSHEESRLYHSTQTTIMEYWRVPSKTNKRQSGVFVEQGVVATLPPGTRPAAAYKLRNKIICTGSAPRKTNPTCPHTDFTSFLKAVPLAHLIGEVHEIRDNAEKIAKGIRSRLAIAVNGGSFKDGKGTASVVIEASDSKNHIRADCKVTGTEMINVHSAVKQPEFSVPPSSSTPFANSITSRKALLQLGATAPQYLPGLRTSNSRSTRTLCTST